jgi:hypothetical protein
MSIDASVFGHNGYAVAKLIERTSRMTADEAEQLYGTMGALTRKASWREDRDSIWSIARDQGRLPTWRAARKAAISAVWDTAWVNAHGGAWDPRWDYAEIAACAAVSALIVQDWILEEHFDALYDPWASVMEAS